MWLRISFGDRPPLLSAMASDGRMYFLAKDVALFLNYKCPKGFAQRHARRDLRLMIPDQMLRYQKAGDRLVFDFEEMIRKMSDTGIHHNVPMEEILAIQRLWYDGFVQAGFPKLIPCTSNLAFSVEIREQGQVKFKDWLARFVRVSLVRFEESRRLEVSPPSVQSNYQDDGPRSVQSDHDETKRRRTEPSFSMVVRAEGSWTVKSADVFDDVVRSMKRKFEEMEPTAEPYELEVKMTQRCQQRQIPVNELS